MNSDHLKQDGPNDPDLGTWKSFEGLLEPGSEEVELLKRIDPERLPAHVAVIMDGNGRWAESQGLSRVRGHYAGAESLREIIENSARLGIRYLTLYAFSVENWKRPKAEVQELMRLLRKYLRGDLPTLQKHNIRFLAIGAVEDLDFRTRNLIRHCEQATAANSGLQLNIALNYGSRAEILRTVQTLAREVARGEISPDQIDQLCFENHLYTAGVPDPDLLIRTSGENRVSNFLLWQIAYTEFYITPVLWPDFHRPHLFAAIIEFQRRERRFGGVKAI
jgi:undecaprenyl diphosphate synthase